MMVCACCHSKPQAGETLCRKCGTYLCKEWLVCDRSYNEWKVLAESGNAEAMAHLGVCLLFGDDTERDVAAAKQWLRAAAEGGYWKALVMLGADMLRTGWDAWNVTEITSLLEGPAGRGDVNAIMLMGSVLLDVGSKNHVLDILSAEDIHDLAEEGTRALKMAAAQGHPGAIARLG